MTARLYAEDTAVPVEKSQAEIGRLLREHACAGVQWTEDWKAGTVQLRFVWPHEGTTYVARITLRIPLDSVLVKGCTIRHKTPEARAAWLAKEREQHLRSAHRVVLVKLKADFAMVRCGMASAVEILLPFLEDASGRTVAEVVAPRLAEIRGPGVAGLIGGER